MADADVNIVTVDESELVQFETGSYNNPCNPDGSWGDDVESEFLNAYHSLFDSLKSIVALVESGDPGDADVAMSRWVDPTRVITIVVRTASNRLRLLVGAALGFLENFPKHAVLIDDYPIRLVMLTSHTIMVPRSVPAEYLRMLGIEK